MNYDVGAAVVVVACVTDAPTSFPVQKGLPPVFGFRTTNLPSLTIGVQLQLVGGGLP